MLTRRSCLAGIALLPTPALSRYRPSEAKLDLLSSPPPTHDTDVVEGDGYRIFRAVPKQASDHALYMLDGNGAFDALTADLLATVPQLTVLAIGYPTGQRFETTRRSLDYTPPVAEAPIPDPEREGRMVGGANLFLPRLTGPLRTSAEQGLSITTRTLWGHSYGGLFTLYALRTKPSSFDRYAAISPSLWWGEGVLTRITPQPVEGRKKVLMAWSDSEARQKDVVDDGARAAAAARRDDFVNELRQTADITVQTHRFPGLAHGQTLGASLPLVLPFAG